MANLEEEVKELKAKIEELENQVGIQQDVTEIMNLMGKYQLWHVPKKIRQTWKLFTMKQPDVSCEICNWGVWVGPESVRRLYEVGHGGRDPEHRMMKGGMFEHHLTTYVIQVAKDRKTAKGVFWSPGHESWARGDDVKATWCYIRYGNDFIREDGEWKIWHQKVYHTFRQDFYTSWQEPTTVPYDLEQIHALCPPDKPTTYFNPYTVDTILDIYPPYPEPYDTWDGKSQACGPIEE